MAKVAMPGSIGQHWGMADYGLIEGGGTKFMLGVANAAGEIRARERVPTTTPDETLGAAIAWFRAQDLQAAAIGIACFGPLELDPAAPDFGHVTRTVKPNWSGADVAGPFAAAFGCPVGIETDVNGAALAESRWGAGKGIGSLLYVTIGTGVGGGFISDGRLLRGASHPEMGHIRLPRHPADRDFAGSCSFHCLEGLVAGPAIAARWGASLSELDPDHPAHEIVAWYLGQAVVTWQAMLQPGRIVLGGGVMSTLGLRDSVRQAAATAGGGYFAGDPREIVVAPGLGTDSGLLGALAVAQQAQGAGA
jgi:fructokinase